MTYDSSNENSYINEIWKPIINFDKYLISNIGRVQNSLSKKILKPTGKKYYYINLYKNKIRYSKSIHVIVAEVFLNYSHNNNNLIIDHVDGNIHNNDVNNLQVISQRLNTTKGKLCIDSNHIGLKWRNSRNIWVARILYKRKRITLGHFTIAENGIKIYKQAVQEIEQNIFNPLNYEKGKQSLISNSSF